MPTCTKPTTGSSSSPYQSSPTSTARSKRAAHAAASPSPTIASSDYMNYYYGVESQFAMSQRPAFDAKSGYLGTELSVAIRQPITKNFEIWGGLQFGFHSGAKNNDSPLYTEDNTQSVYVAFL